MKNKFLMYAIIAAVLSFLPSLLPGYLKYSGCLVLIGSIIYLYKLYGDGLENKEVLTIGLGAKFGVLVGAVLLVMSLVYILSMSGDLRSYMIEQAIENGTGEEQVEAMEQMSDTFVYISMGVGFTVNFVLSVLIGVIAGAIFKHEKE
jgi:hypothetical protein